MGADGPALYRPSWLSGGQRVQNNRPLVQWPPLKCIKWTTRNFKSCARFQVAWFLLEPSNHANYCEHAPTIHQNILPNLKNCSPLFSSPSPLWFFLPSFFCGFNFRKRPRRRECYTSGVGNNVEICFKNLRWFFSSGRDSRSSPASVAESIETFEISFSGHMFVMRNVWMLIRIDFFFSFKCFKIFTIRLAVRTRSWLATLETTIKLQLKTCFILNSPVYCFKHEPLVGHIDSWLVSQINIRRAATVIGTRYRNWGVEYY